MTKEEQLFSRMLTKFKEHAKEIIEEVARDVEVDYLPYINSDLEMNVYSATYDAITAILAGDQEAIARYGVNRCAMYQKPLVNAFLASSDARDSIIKEQQMEIEHLKAVIEDYHKAVWRF